MRLGVRCRVRTMRRDLFLLPLLLFALTGCEDLTVIQGEELEGDDPGECSDDADNDGDGDFDCDDADCAGSQACACDDADGDGVCDEDDVCPDADDTLDADADGVPDGCDVCPDGDDGVDTDGDGVADACDVCPDGDDGVDTDGDGVADDCDVCPDGDDTVDTDGDGVPDDCDVCPDGDDTVDTDGDGVADDCDVCPDGDDGVDTDGDGVADACDPCPDDDLDDTDSDGVCDSDDICPGFDDTIDTDGDGIPDGCEVDPSTPVVTAPADDYDVAADGAIRTVRANGGDILLTCYSPAFSVAVAEFSVGSYNTSSLGPYPTVQVSQGTGAVIVTWHDSGGGSGAQRVKYTYLDDTCSVLAMEQTAIGPVDEYFEWHTTAIDDLGRAVIGASDDFTYLGFVDATGAAAAPVSVAPPYSSVYGTHVAVSPLTGDGVITVQRHSGDGIWYRRFTASGTWTDASWVQIPVNYHYWYDGHTVGMNDAGEFVLLWRSDGVAIDMKFFDASGTLVNTIQRTTIDFEGWSGGHCYDSFRRRNQQIPLRGDNFVLGEVYNWITPAANRITQHFEYTPAGVLVTEDSTDKNDDSGLTLRIDGLGRSFAMGPSGIYLLGIYP